MSNVRQFGAAGDGQRDDSPAIEHALRDGEGQLEFPPGTYRLTRPIVVELASQRRFAITGAAGTAKLVMAGPGPALAITGTHAASADPAGFRPEVWERERMPMISGLEIEGAHPEADGIRLDGVMQPVLAGVLIREVRHALHVTRRARNLLVTHCHFYHNTGIGIFLDRVNLHQAIVTGSHISYCREGGLRIEASEIRNLQVTGNDIEYNNHRSHAGHSPEPVADVLIDAREGTVREGTITGNTIQATYSPGGANIRFLGAGPEASHRAGLWTIAGNLLGSQEVNVHLSSVRGVTVTGNILYSGHSRNLLIEHSRNVVVSGNVFDHNPDYEPKELCTGVRLADSEDCTLGNMVIQDCQAGRHTVTDAGPLAREALLELVRCRRINLSGISVFEGAPAGIALEECRDTVLTGCTVLDRREPPLMRVAIRWQGDGSGNLISGCRVGQGSDGAIVAPPGVRQWNNLPG